MQTLLYNIQTLVQVREHTTAAPICGKGLAHLPTLNDAWLLIDGDTIKDYGTGKPPEADGSRIDCTDRMVFPSWVDSHTHLVFAATREAEFVYRLKGMSYAEIAAKGGGILNSARRLRELPEEVLYAQAKERLDNLIRHGTGAIEIKSGYGLTVESELKMLRVIRRLKENSPIPVKATFLGAHALPAAFKANREGYLDVLLKELLPQIATAGLADYIDVFCEKGFFSVAEAERVMAAGHQYGLRAKIHTNQFNCMGGIQAAVKHNALSVDHLEVVNEEEMAALAGSGVMATLLPSAPFFLNDHYPPARQLIDAHLPLALASDYNPGTSPSGKMAFVVALACIKMKMLPEEAINAATLNGAAALELSHSHGSITRGKQANLFISKKMPSIAYIPYAFTDQIADQIIVNGKVLDKEVI